MKILGNSYQEKGPNPEEPIEIKNENYIFGNIDGQPINIPYNPKVERLKYFQKINGKWHAVFEPISKEEKIMDFKAKRNAENNKPINIILNIGLVFYEEESKENQWGSNDISFEIYYNTKKGVMTINEVGAFGDRTFINSFQDRRGRGITLKEMLENVEQISQMSLKEFREMVGCKLLEEEND